MDDREGNGDLIEEEEEDLEPDTSPEATEEAGLTTEGGHEEGSSEDVEFEDEEEGGEQ